MFRVPADPNTPTFNDTTRVSIWRWLTSTKPERQEWARRRNLAAQTARTNQDQRVTEWRERKESER